MTLGVLRDGVAVSIACMLFTGCTSSVQVAQRAEDPYVAAFRSIRKSVALVTVDGDTPEYGSAFVIGGGDHGSYLITDEHVVAHPTRITLQIGSRVVGTARVVLRDRRDDVAVLYTKTRRLPAVALGTSSGLEPGVQIGIAGYPIPDAFADAHFGLTLSLYTGRVASVRPGILEVDMPVIPGDSGAPVFEAATARVIALGEARFDDERAIGLATPIDLIKPRIRRYVEAR